MWALVESGSITKMWSRPQAFNIGDTQYPANTMALWSESQLQSIGVYPVTIDNTNLKDTNYYINTDITYTVDGLTVKGTYGTATALSLTDSLYTQEDEDAGLGTKDDVKQDGLKNYEIIIVDDGSKDNTAKIIENVKASSKNIVFHNGFLLFGKSDTKNRCSFFDKVFISKSTEKHFF